MFAGLSAFLATTTGKVVLGVTVAGAAVGGAQSTDVTDLTGPDAGTATTVDDAVPTTETTSVPVDEDVGIDEDLPGDDETESGPGNHGQTVSEFARSTELDGCERGQAIAEVASSRAADHRQDPDRDHDPCGQEPGDDEPPEAPEDDGVGNGPARPPVPGTSGSGPAPEPPAAGPPNGNGPPAHAGGPKS